MMTTHFDVDDRIYTVCVLYVYTYLSLWTSLKTKGIYYRFFISIIISATAEH